MEKKSVKINYFNNFYVREEEALTHFAFLYQLFLSYLYFIKFGFQLFHQYGY